MIKHDWVLYIGALDRCIYRKCKKCGLEINPVGFENGKFIWEPL